MTMVSNPVSTNYGLNDDGKTGLCTPDEFVEGRAVPNKYSKFNMVVPTVAIQNHTKESTKVLFFEKNDTNTKNPIAQLTCGIVTIHIQLIGVQHNCNHKVSFPLI